MHPTEVADEIGRTLSERSRSGRNGPHATRRHVRRATGTVDFSTVEHTAYNEPFTMAELRSAIGALRDVSEGPDAIHTSMLRRLPTIAEEALLAMFNSLWETGVFPDAWREETVVPILKPGRSGLDPLHYRRCTL